MALLHEIRSLFKGQFTGGKDEREAAVFKEKGNLHFKKRELKQSLQCYSKAVLMSPWPSTEKQRIVAQLLGQLEASKLQVATDLLSPRLTDGGVESSLLAVCIGNRSAVLLEINRIKDCLGDIDLALSLNFPEDSEHKLHRRRACCLAHLGNRAAALEALETAEQKLATFSQTKKDQHMKELKLYHKKIEIILQDYQQSGPRRRGSNRFRERVSERGAHESPAITPDSCSSKGRFLRAAGPINAGEVVMSEEAYAATLNTDLYLTHCSYCFNKTSALIPCCLCTSDGYCSSGCREKAWAKYHWLECSVAHLWIKADWMMRLALRMVASAPSSVLHGAVSKITEENGVDVASCCIPDSDLTSPIGPYTSILSLVSHQNKFPDIQQKAMFEKMADTLMDCFGGVIREYLHAHNGSHLDRNSSSTHDDANTDLGLRALFLYHLLQLRCNSHSVRAVEETEVERDGEGGREGGREGGEVVQSTHEIQVGSAIFPTASLFNHSCWPNIIFRFVGRSVVVVATKPIAKGEEINNCYGPQVGRMKRTERVAELQRKYFFDCSCPACAQSDASLEYQEIVVDAFRCSECGGAVGRGQWQCCDCSTTMESCEIERIQEILSETQAIFSAVQVGSKSGLPELLKCHALQSQVLHKHNLQLARTSDAVAHTYASLGQFAKAAEFCGASCRAVEAVHGSHSIELATELHKLAQLLFNSRQFTEAGDVVEKALPLLRLYLHPHHPNITELQQMKDCLSQCT